MRAIDGDRLKRKAQKVATEAWKMKIKANVEVILNEFIDWINDAPTIEPEPHWISCSERLPKETGKYLITEEDGEVCVDTYLVKHNEWYECFPIAWMPLPEPYKEGES